MTSITTTPVSPRQKTEQVRSDISANTAAPIEPLLATKSQASPTVISSASSPAMDGFLSKVFDILHKMNGNGLAPVTPSLDGEDLQAMLARVGGDRAGLVTSAEFVAARPEHISEDDAVRLFASIDIRGEGAVALDRLTSALASPAVSDETSSLAALGIEGDIGVNREQFLASMPLTESPDDAVKSLLRLLGGKADDEAQA